MTDTEYYDYYNCSLLYYTLYLKLRYASAASTSRCGHRR